MEDKARPDDFRLLGLSPQANAEELDRAYHRARAIYSEGSLATYSMMDETERAAMRERIEGAHMRIGGAIARLREASFTAEASPAEGPAAAPDATPAVVMPGGVEAPAAEDPAAADGGSAPVPALLDWGKPPGPQLRRIREGLGVTLKQIATATRVRSTHFANIEEERVAELPAAVYLRGFLLDYARYLRLPDPEGVAVRYLEWATRHLPNKE